MRQSLSLIALVIAAAVVWWMVSAPGSPAGGAPSGVSDVDGVPAAAEMGGPRQVGAAGRVSVEPARLLRIVAAGDLPLAGAELRPYGERDDGTMNLDSEPLAVSDADGLIVHPILARSEQRLLIRCDSHVPAVVLGGFEGERTLRLERGSSLTVHVISDSGVPLPEAQVVVSAKVLSTITGLPGLGDGAPLHPRPVWSRFIGPSGHTVIRDLPSGRYFVKAFHPLYAALGGIEDSRPVVIDGDVELTFTLQDMYGVVFECPSPEPVESEAWVWDLNQLDQSNGVVSRLATCRTELRKRFPDGHVFVHRPAFPDQPTMVGCQLVLRDGTFWSGSWPLRPLREVTTPVFLEQDIEAHYRQVKVELISKSGRALDVPLQVIEWKEEYRERPAAWTALPGRTLFLRYGRYVAEPKHVAAWWAPASGEPLTFDVSATVPGGDVVRLQVDADFVPLQFVPVFPGDAPLCPLHIWIDDPLKQGMAIVNWKREDGPIHLLVPAGRVSILVRSAHYQDLELTVEVDADDVGRQIELPVVERS